ncbi:MAG TPA: hypothetical protein EYN58_03515 [Candidatus Poseidoniales archaeon]|nr:hypothetical protein [Candidatus Poseidoniales archaeon]
MTRNDAQKKRRIDFSASTVEQKEKYEAAIAESGMNKSAFMRMALDQFVDSPGAENPIEIYKDKEISRLKQEIEQLRGALSLKARANEHMDGELRRVRARLTGDMGQLNVADLANQVGKLLKQAGILTHKELLSQIDEPHKIPNLTQQLNEIESALHREGKITLLEGDRIQWIG